VELNNVKGEKRFFLPQVDAIEWDAQTRTLTIPFEYRPLTPEEQKRYGEKNQQKTIIDVAVKEIPSAFKRRAILNRSSLPLPLKDARPTKAYRCPIWNTTCADTRAATPATFSFTKT
jgi:hypothetical protein